MTKFLCFIGLLFCIPLATFADGFDYKFPSYSKIIVPDSLKNQDAFFITKNTTIDFTDDYTTSIIYFDRIYLNSKKGVEDYMTFDTPIYQSGNVTMIKSRIIKESGETVDIQGDNIKKTFLKGKFDFSQVNMNRIQIIYPDLNVGDVIDIAYVITFPYYIISDMFYLEAELPSLHTKFALRNYGNMNMTVFNVNSSSAYSRKHEVCTWERKGVSVQNDGGFNAFHQKSPRFFFSLLPPTYNLNLSLIYSLDTDNYPVKWVFKKKMTLLLIAKELFSETHTNLFKLDAVINYINAFDWLDTDEYNANLSLLDYLKDRKINEKLFFRYIHLFLDENEINYDRCFTSHLLNGPFNANVLAFAQFDNRFLSVPDSKNNYHFVFPPESSKRFYKLDEIPFFFEGNDAVLLNGTDISLKEIRDLSLPQSQMYENKHTCQVRMNVNLVDSVSCFSSRKDILTGHFSNLVKNKGASTWMQSFNVSDTILPILNQESKYPYDLEFSQDSLKTNSVEKIDDSLAWVNALDFLPENIFDESDENTNLGNYLVLPFKYFKSFAIYLEVGQGVTVMENDVVIQISNGIGEISAKCMQMSPNMVKLEYQIKLKERIVNGEESVSEYRSFLSKWQEVRTKKWIVKI
jgi:hypothetical protein